MGHRFLRQVAFVDQALETECRLDGVEVFPLDVLHDGHFEHSGIVGLADIGGYTVQAGGKGGPVTALTADNLIFVGFDLPERQRLDDTETADGGSQFFEGFGVEGSTGLVGVGHDPVDGDLVDCGGIAEQGAESTP